VNLNVHKESYLIEGVNVTVVADFLNENIYIHNDSYRSSVKFPLDEYTEFEGNAKDFAKLKLGL